MKRIYIYLFFILLTFTIKVTAQHPVFTHLTEKDGLPDIEFYSIIEDSKGFIWLGADKGLFRYDGKEFKNYTHPEKRGLSVFGLEIDSKGRIWCNNISGQFFYVENDELILFKDLKEEVKGQLAVFSFYQNDLITSTETGMYNINVDNLLQNRLFDKKAGFYPFNVKKNSLISLYDHEVMVTKKKQKSVVKYDLGAYKKYEFNKWQITSFKNKDLIYAHNTNDLKVKPKLFYEQKDRLKEVVLPEKIQNNVIITFYEQNEELWLCTDGGLFIYELNKGKLIYKRTYFKGKLVSGVLRDRNNNYWITTLRNGIYIIPNLYIERYDIDDEKMNISAMSRIGKDSLIIGSTKGHLGILNKKKNELTFFKKEYNDKVYSIRDSKNKVYLSLGVSSSIYDKNRKIIYEDRFCANAKDLSLIDESNILYASHNSATIINIENKSVCLLKKARAYTTYYSTKKEIYVGYVDGVEKYDKQKIASKILFNNKPIFAIDITETADGTIWISTFKDGLIGVKNGKAVLNYTVNNGLLSNQTGKIKGDGKLLWIASDKGLQALNVRTGEIKNLTKKDGINSFNISEILPFKKVLFFSSNKGLFKINKEKVFKVRNILDFYFTSVLINDKEVVEKEKYVLSSKEKKIKFGFHTNGFLAEDNIVFKYKLISDLDVGKWSTIDKGVNQVTFNNLAAGRYSLKLKAIELNGKKETTEKLIVLEVKLPFYKEWWFLLTIITFLFILIWFFFTKRFDELEKIQRQAIEKERMQRALVASKLETLQSQMNPHFTFNALNSIQNLVLKGNKQEAYNYLTKFSLLLRENLLLSTKSFVYFDEELSLIKKYLELEKLRFRDNFVYEIKGEEFIDDIKIPTMIIQPFIENAIKHGLHHKIKGLRKIKIEFSQENLFKCVITDNGIGFKAAAEINKRTKNKSVSFSTKAINDKLKILKEFYKTDIGFEYVSTEKGTKVILKIPFKH
ncbi:histidine kinase [Tenacibaculum ovolyticum]|uniref:sensor histidine kinase n=1 Tax=Tenacibaculum ovolyticum TaxID=104270 RepID=UPI0022F404A9|nr:histidine kinase [Tenacibaculum ovolyticum]WBX75689.1 histidine kinase [Tenacibaculum ovolyticum]